jgi:transposase
LKRVAHPHEVVVHPAPTHCDACGRTLESAQAEVLPSGCQVIELPPIRFKVSAHRLQMVRCTCGKIHAGRYPQGVTQAVQYGPALKAGTVYLTQYQHLSVQRCAQATKDFVGVLLSTGSVQAAINQAALGVKPVAESIADHIWQAPVAHFDETGMRVGATLYWQHSASTGNTV